MNIYTIDLETYYAQGFSLNGMSTEAYIRDPRFEAIMVSIKKNDEPAQNFAGDAMDTQLNLMRDTLAESAILCHHAHFDGLILSHHYNIKPRMWFDTLSMARAVHGVEVGGSLAKLSAHYNLGEKGVAVKNMFGKHLADLSPNDLKEYGEYCNNDVELTYALFSKLLPKYQKSELHSIDVFIRMFTEPELMIDSDLADRWVVEIQQNKAKLVMECGASKDELMSNDKFALQLEKALEGHPQDVPRKISPATGKSTWAFAKSDEAFMALREHDDEVVQALIEARLGNKTTINETRGKKFADMGRRGRAPVYIKYAGAAQTLRSSGGDGMNWQNLGKTKTPRDRDTGRWVMTPAGWGELLGIDRAENEEGEYANYHTDMGLFCDRDKNFDVHLVGLRDLVHAEPGKVLVVADSANIEARVLAALAGQHDAVDRFRHKIDPYCHMAASIFGRPITKADKMERQLGKVAVLGLGYGMGAAKFQDTVRQWGLGDIDFVLAKTIVDTYRRTYDKVPQLWKRFESALPFIQSGTLKHPIDPGGILVTGPQSVILPSGLAVRYPELVKNADGWQFWGGMSKGKGADKTHLGTKVYGGLATENCVQALARIIVTEQMNKVSLLFNVKWFVHDEIICHVPEEDAGEALAVITKIMQTSPDWWPEVPLDAEGAFHQTYSLAK